MAALQKIYKSFITKVFYHESFIKALQKLYKNVVCLHVLKRTC